MKTVFDPSTRDELINRISLLDENSKAQWGKMNVYQMLKHCAMWEEMVFGRIHCKRSFLGRIFGKMALKGLIKDDRPIQRNMPSSSELVVNDNLNGSVEPGKKRWITLINKYAHYSDSEFVHPFFGTMTRVQIGHFAYKHSDHHLRQFKG
jgi:hypothetical protein